MATQESIKHLLVFAEKQSKISGQIDEIADQGISGQLAKGAATRGFKPNRQVLELHGDCQTCRE